MPLWNHNTTVQSFVTYTGYKFSEIGRGGNGGPAPQPDGPSRMCLSCHDGVSAVNEFGGKYQGPAGTPSTLYSGFTFAPAGNGATNGGLNNMHPISFVYDQTLATNDGSLYNPVSHNTSMGGTIQSDLLDQNNKVQCPSCHEVHDPTITPFLRINNAGSALCLTCHAK
jgi:predicted CXXCH cytochrome family protein